MNDDVTLTGDDEGKPVITSNGDRIGSIATVERGKAYVDPNPGLTDTIRSKLGSNESDETDYLLNTSSIESVSDDAIHLSR